MSWIRRVFPLPAPVAPEPGVISFYERMRAVRRLREDLKQRRLSTDPAERAHAEAGLLEIREVLGAHPLNDDLARLIQRWGAEPPPSAST